MQDVRPGVTVRLLDESHLGVTALLDHIAPHGRLRIGDSDGNGDCSIA